MQQKKKKFSTSSEKKKDWKINKIKKLKQGGERCEEWI